MCIRDRAYRVRDRETAWEAFNTTAVALSLSTLFLFLTSIVLVIATSLRGRDIDLGSVGASATVLVTSALLGNALFSSRSMLFRVIFYEREWKKAKKRKAAGVSVDEMTSLVLDDLDRNGKTPSLWTPWRKEEKLRETQSYLTSKLVKELNGATATAAGAPPGAPVVALSALGGGGALPGAPLDAERKRVLLRVVAGEN